MYVYTIFSDTTQMKIAWSGSFTAGPFTHTSPSPCTPGQSKGRC